MDFPSKSMLFKLLIPWCILGCIIYSMSTLRTLKLNFANPMVASPVTSRPTETPERSAVTDTPSEHCDIMKNITMEEFFSVVDNRSDNIFQIWPLKPMSLYRALCSVESWSLNHPKSSVWFIFTVKELQDPDGLLHKLITKYSNLRYIYIDLQKAFVGTAFYDIGLRSAWNTSEWPGVHLSDLLRQALVWQKGGYYADTDVFAMRSFNDQRNFILSNKERVDASLMHFDAHHPFLTANMETGAARYNPHHRAGLSISSSSKTAISTCNVTKHQLLPDGDLPYRECTLGRNGSFRLLSFEFCPQCCEPCMGPQSELYIDKFVKSRAYAFHICNGHTRQKSIAFESASIMNVMATRNCPIIFKHAQEHSNFW